MLLTLMNVTLPTQTRGAWLWGTDIYLNPKLLLHRVRLNRFMKYQPHIDSTLIWYITTCEWIPVYTSVVSKINWETCSVKGVQETISCLTQMY